MPERVICRNGTNSSEIVRENVGARFRSLHGKLTNTCMDPQAGYVQDASSPCVRIAWAGQSVEIRLLDFDPNISADRWPDDVRVSDLEPHFVCQACGQRGADIRPDFPVPANANSQLFRICSGQSRDCDRGRVLQHYRHFSDMASTCSSGQSRHRTDSPTGLLLTPQRTCGAASRLGQRCRSLVQSGRIFPQY
jgi:hypothetical protein